jgi:ribosomal-protein-alanine N-acetyltransferase
MAVSWMPDNLVIRPVEAADLDELVDIERTTFSDPWTRGGFASALTVDGAVVLCARERDQVLGYVVAWFVVDEGQIANLAVRESARRSGVGGALLDATLTEARRKGVSRVTLEVRAANAAALALYRSRGFEAVGRRRAYYRSPVEDAVVLRWGAGIKRSQAE